MTATAAEPDRDCPLCPRLSAFRAGQREAHPTWHNAPVPSFGADARLLIVGLAPGLQGANRTGRCFTGDWAGDLLYETLDAFGFSQGHYAEDPDDGLTLVDTVITNAVRCVPPANKPTGPEIATCRPFLIGTMGQQPRLTVLVALGRIAHESVLRALGQRLAAYPFGHGREHAVSRIDGHALTMIDSYHCSRYNTNTGVLTPPMFRAVFARARAILDGSAPVAQQA
ncbi:uracil-DNA glycosylase [Lichenihabitans sp. Uapishka_5]|uniref:uracil-DNA glycosylase n=1 Tax=Lichenihabitans sp. Uapishka_5 TaxID=3037302 RepID=UPI0029E7CD09|nr:uracil-DNA glycosylase [Lichenihabitans sp. Uapishka_5]MDX7950760.1 uracil-DNA glycosylase [Lichenihabitans sp. Uapishka_5]